MIVYAATILVSAFLLFQVQPLIGKVILPWFGGSAAVWSATLMFFQVGLLAGYAYAHFLIRRFGAKVQMFVHVGLLLVSLALLPILPGEGWKPTTAADPTLRILALLAVSVGLPYFLLSSTSPLLQAWYVRRTGSAVPYRLFALSNFGSMLGLLSFPFLVEPSLTSRQQAWGWSAIYVGFVALCALVAWVSRREAAAPAPIAGGAMPPTVPSEVSEAPEAPVEPPDRPRAPRWTDLALWVILAATASTLLVSVTTHLTQDVAPIPLLWVVPLALYLLTFIAAFESDRFYHRWIVVPLAGVSLGFMAYLLRNPGSIVFVIAVFLVGLFLCCFLCHGELARRRPDPVHLTIFYLMVALGGAVGGSFVALVAPRVFNSYLELPIGMVVCGLLAVVAVWNLKLPRVGAEPLRWVGLILVALLAGNLTRQHIDTTTYYSLLTRNFYGTLAVEDRPQIGRIPPVRVLIHGVINHGFELRSEENSGSIPTSYFGRGSGISRALRSIEGSRRVGILGLGAGVTASLGRDGDTFRYYEIDAEVERIAREDFTFLSSTPADVEVLLGDGRLVLERLPSERLDLLAMDAFTSDAVPVHLLTRQAFEIYRNHVKPGGIIAVNISNRYLDLRPVIAAAAERMGWSGVLVEDPGSGEPYYTSSVWAILSESPDTFETRHFRADSVGPLVAPSGFREWTDSYSNLFRILK